MGRVIVSSAPRIVDEPSRRCQFDRSRTLVDGRIARKTTMRETLKTIRRNGRTRDINLQVTTGTTRTLRPVNVNKISREHPSSRTQSKV